MNRFVATRTLGARARVLVVPPGLAPNGFRASTGPVAASGDQPEPDGQPGPLQRPGVRERDGPGQGRHRDVQPDPAGRPGGVRPHGEGSPVLFLRKNQAHVPFMFFVLVADVYILVIAVEVVV